jgi:predicted phage terminase large subunit-like protein
MTAKPRPRPKKLKDIVPNFKTGDTLITPNSLPQQQFVQSPAFEAFYCGGNGSGKTFALSLAALREYENPNYQAVLFRNTMKEVKMILVKETSKIYPLKGGILNKTDWVWTFPSGAKIYLSYLRNAADIDVYLGSEFQFIGFDELKTFQEEDYLGLMKRLRGTDKTIKRKIRGTSNPHADWIFYRYHQWLAHDHTSCVDALEKCYKAGTHNHGCQHCPESGKVRNVDGIITQVIMGSWWENRHSVEATPEYEHTLKSGSRLETAYYYYNDWTIRAAAGTYFKRGSFQYVDAAPTDCKWFRGWDLAFSLTGDYTVGVLIGIKNGLYYVCDMVRDRINESNKLEEMIINTASWDGQTTHISLPKEPAGAGGYQMNALSKLLAGYQFSLRSEKIKTDIHTTAKEAKALAFAAQVAAGNVKIVRDTPGHRWNNDFIGELEEFPMGRHDDITDAVCGAFNASIGQVYLKYRGFGINVRPRLF